MKKSMFRMVLLLVLTVLTVPAYAAPQFSLRFAGQFPDNHYATGEMKAMAKEIAEKTKGNVVISVFPANQLGDYTLVYEDIIRGTIDMCMMSLPSQFDKRLEIVYINGYVRGPDDAKKVIDPNGWMFKKIDELQSVFGVKTLALYFEGMGGYASTKPIKAPLDPKVPKGVLLRIPNMAVYKLSAEATGYRTVTIPYADVYQALQTGVCDALTGYSPLGVYTMLGDLVKHYYRTINSVEFLNIAISPVTWAKLPPEYQKTIQDVTRKYAAKSVNLAIQEENKALELLKKKGVKIYSYTPEELLPLAKAYASTWDQLADKGMTKELMDEFKREMTPK